MERTKLPSTLWAKEIEWEDIDIIDILERLDEMPSEAAAEALEIPSEQYVSMTTAERHDYACDYFRGRNEAKAELIGLPTETKIPDSIAEDDYDAISDWLTDKYGFCHKKFIVGRKQTFTVPPSIYVVTGFIDGMGYDKVIGVFSNLKSAKEAADKWCMKNMPFFPELADEEERRWLEKYTEENIDSYGTVYHISEIGENRIVISKTELNEIL